MVYASNPINSSPRMPSGQNAEEYSRIFLAIAESHSKTTLRDNLYFVASKVEISLLHTLLGSFGIHLTETPGDDRRNRAVS